MMSGSASLVYAAMFFAGIALGTFYFGGLWWTVDQVTRGRQSGWLLAVSFALRVTVLLVGLYFVLTGGIWHLLACLVGLAAARALFVRSARFKTPDGSSRARGD